MISYESMEKYLVERKVQKIDENEELDMYSYISCDEKTEPELKRFRGVVFDKEHHLIANALPFTDTLVVGMDDDAIKSVIKQTSRIFVSCEGCTIRVFYGKSRWYISTNRKLDSTKSRWSSDVTFGDLFRLGISRIISAKNGTKNAIDDDMHTFLDMLDRNLTYYFIIQNTKENRIVCDGTSSTDPVIYFSGVQRKCSPVFEFDLNDKFRELGFETCSELKQGKQNEKIDFTKPDFIHLAEIDPEQVEQMEGWNEHSIMEYIQRVLNINRSPGVIVFNEDILPCKIVSKQYYERFTVRGNQPQLSYRYLEIRHQPEMVKLFKLNYPESESLFNDIEYVFENVAQFILKCYRARHITHQYVFINKEEHVIAEECHKLYLRTRVPITIEHVRNVMNQQDPRYLHNIFVRNIKR